MASKRLPTPPRFQPTPIEIRNGCEEIQLGWTEREHRRRAGQDPDVGWTPPTISTSELLGDASGVDCAA